MCKGREEGEMEESAGRSASLSLANGVISSLKANLKVEKRKPDRN